VKNAYNHRSLLATLCTIPSQHAFHLFTRSPSDSAALRRTELMAPPSMEASLKNLLLRRRSKSNPPATNGVPQESLQQTSSYAAVSPGPAPKVGTLPLKPSQEKQPRRSLSHARAKIDGLRGPRQATESANIGRPRTSTSVKPFFIGVSKPASSKVPLGSSSRGTGRQLDGMVPPPVPPLPKDLDLPHGPRYHDVMQFAAKQPISRATFNEHVAARNMGLPRKSVDVLDAEANQLSGGRYNEYVAIRNMDIPRQPVNPLREEGALRSTALPDTRSIKSEAMGASKDGLRPHDRNDTPENTRNKVPGRGAPGLETLSSAHGTRAGKGKTLEAYRDVQTLGSRTPPGMTASTSQAPKLSRSALHSPNHSGRQNDQFVKASSLAQSRIAGSPPPGWLSHGKTNSSSSADMRTQSMTASIPSGIRNDVSDYRQDSESQEISKDQKSMAQTFWKVRNEVAQHSTSRSLSVLEGRSSRDIFGSTTSTSTGSQQKTSTRDASTLTNGVPQPLPDTSPGSHVSSRRPSMGKNTTSTHWKRTDASGRTVMDLTNDLRPDNTGHPAHRELSEELQQPASRHASRAGLSYAVPEAPNTTALEPHTLNETSHAESSAVEKTVLPPTGRSGGTGTGTELPSQTASANDISIAVIDSSSERVTSGNTSKLGKVSSLANSQPASFHTQATLPIDPLAGMSPLQDQQQVSATPERPQSSNSADPSGTPGVLTRDFAISPATGQNSHLPPKKAQPLKESTPGKLTPIMATKLPAGPEKLVHHISSFTLPQKQPRGTETSHNPIAFDEDAFQRRQAEARAALLQLERDLQQNFAFAFDSLNGTTGKDAPLPFRNLSLEEGAPIAPISRFSSIRVPASAYQKKGSSGNSRADSPLGEWGPQRGSSIPALVMKSGVLASGIHSTTKYNTQNSMIPTISESDAEQSSPIDSAPAPTIPLSPSGRGRSVATQQSARRRRPSVASTGSGSSTFSVPPHLVPDRTSSIRNSDVPEFHIDDARWE
jgi:hypothetical protein